MHVALKGRIFHIVLNSLFLYFTELRDDKIRKDFEILKNLISHFKILNFLIGEEAFQSKPNAETDEESKKMIVEISLLSFFLGTSMEDAMFLKAKNLIETAKLIVIKKNNEFYFSSRHLKLVAKSGPRANRRQDADRLLELLGLQQLHPQGPPLGRDHQEPVPLHLQAARQSARELPARLLREAHLEQGHRPELRLVQTVQLLPQVALHRENPRRRKAGLLRGAVGLLLGERVPVLRPRPAR